MIFCKVIVLKMKPNLAFDEIYLRFDRAAKIYDQGASLQVQVARELVERARQSPAPFDILDIGCGTGFASRAAAQKWPRASLTALDCAPSMLKEAARKIPGLKTIAADAAEADFPPGFDLILSSMALHWLPDPQAALLRWRRWLKPQGAMHIALPISGSFQEWRDLCGNENISDGLWPLPPEDFAGDSADGEVRIIRKTYPSAQEFLQSLKTIGAALPRKGHRPISAAIMRKLLYLAPQPFAITYKILFLNITGARSQ